MKYTYIQDEFVPTEEAKIPTSDRGFRFGDGVFETIRIEYGRLYNVDYHLSRLSKGLLELRIPFNVTNLRGIARSLVKKNLIERGFVRISISRGSGSHGYLPTGNIPTIVIETLDRIPVTDDFGTLFVSTQKAQTITQAKTMNALHYTMAMVEAEEAKCDNAILLDDKGRVCETASGNLFWFTKGKLCTPSIKLEMIPGSIRQKIFNLYKGEIIEGEFKMKDLEKADEVFMTNVNVLVLPIQEIKPVGFKYPSNEKSLKIRKLILDDIKNKLG